MDFLKGFLDLHSLISFLLGLVPSGYLIYKFVSFLIRKEIRIFENLKRTVYLITTGDKDLLQREKVLLKENGLFCVHDEILSLSDVGLLEIAKPSSIFVIGYSTGFSQYQKIIDRAKRDTVPIIFLAKSEVILPSHMEMFREYPYFDMCNTSSRLLSTIFNISVITPNAKHD